MTESIPTTWNDQRDAAFFGIASDLAADGFAADLAAQIDKVLEDLVAAESWETMATRHTARSTPHRSDLVPAPIAARLRPAS